MTLSSFHKNIKKAWGKGYYGYWDNKENKAVRIGTGKPSDSVVKERNEDTGMYWVGKRGRLELSVIIVCLYILRKPYGAARDMVK